MNENYKKWLVTQNIQQVSTNNNNNLKQEIVYNYIWRYFKNINNFLEFNFDSRNKR